MKNWIAPGLLALAALAATGTTAAAQVTANTSASANQASPQLREACDRLANLVLPDSMVEGQVDRIVEATLDAIYVAEPAMKEFEAAYPGMRDALGAAMKPVIVFHARRYLPLQRAELSQLYQSRLTLDEASRIADFMAGPAMSKFTAAARANIEFKGIAKSLAAEKDATASDLRGDIGAAGGKAVATLTPAERQQIAAFMFSPLGIKLNSLRNEKLAIDTKWANYTDAEGERDIEAAIKTAMVEHIALTDPEVAQQMKAELEKPDPGT